MSTQPPIQVLTTAANGQVLAPAPNISQVRVNANQTGRSSPQVIAPRPVTPVSITPGMVFMRNAAGQTVLVQQASQASVNSTTTATAGVGAIRTGISQSNAIRSANVVRNTLPPGTRIIRPAGPTLQGQPRPTQAVQAVQADQMRNMKKCTQFFNTLLKLASDQSEASTVSEVNTLIQDLIDDRTQPEAFTGRLQELLKSSPQPYLVPFLKKSLPMLRHAMILGRVNIEGIRTPPRSVLPSSRVITSAPVRQTLQPSVRPSVAPSPVRPGQAVQRPAVVSNMAQIGVPGMMNQPYGAGTRTPLHHPAGVLQPRHPAVRTSTPSMHRHPLPTQIKREVKIEEPANKKAKFESSHIKDDDDINDVAAMGGVNLSEETKNIMAGTSDIGRQIRSCGDEPFIPTASIAARIREKAASLGISDVSKEAAVMISHGMEERLRNIVERLALTCDHRMELMKNDEKYEVSQDVRSQIKLFEEIDKLEQKRHSELERRMLIRAAKSRSKNEDPEQAKLKKKAKAMQMAEQEESQQHAANLTALAAIGPRKRKNEEEQNQPGSNSGQLNSSTSSLRSMPIRQRMKRVNRTDLIHVLETDHKYRRSDLLYRLYLKRITSSSR